jgi:hypothetical protein
MASSSEEVVAAKPKGGLSVDWWAVLLAVVLAVLVRFGVLQHIPW